MTKSDLRKIEFFLAGVIRSPYDLKMVANGCGCPWLEKHETKLGKGFEQFDIYIKPSYFGDGSRKQWIAVSAIFNNTNCVSTQPCVWLIDSKIAKARVEKEHLTFRKQNEKYRRYMLPKNLEDIA